MTVTRREKWYAKLCWPEIDTQRTMFLYAQEPKGTWFLAVPQDNTSAVYISDTPPPDFRMEKIELGKWVWCGRRRAIVARWGYSPTLDTVIVRYIEAMTPTEFRDKGYR